MSEIDTSGSVRDVEVFRMVESCDTPQIERAEQQGIQTAPKRETILRLLDECHEKADANQLDNPTWSKANHQARTELCT